jgi:DNA-binding IscR family transcriptional regulator
MQQLSRAGLVISQRGPHGGFVLTRSPEAMTFMEVIAAVDAPRPTGRLNSMPSDALSRRLDATRAQIEATYRATTVAQFLLENDALVPACSSPA